MGELPDEVLSLDLPCGPEAPAIVRTELARHEGLGWIMGDAVLVASELVTNAVLHSGCGPEHLIHITASVQSDCLTIRVEDPGLVAGSAFPRWISEFTDAGAGLMIVDQLVDRWGAERDGGYRVWAELALHPAQASAAAYPTSVGAYRRAHRTGGRLV
ncbi:MAG TPA: ATP-binding protein [Solirubrobacteraceae bacterium]|nr:ATP-binding protein [Solirubrobacteraceae bacterium]